MCRSGGGVLGGQVAVANGLSGGLGMSGAVFRMAGSRSGDAFGGDMGMRMGIAPNSSRVQFHELTG